MTTASEEKVQKATARRQTVPVAFKYYIHDTDAGYSLEMSGALTESSVSELRCCWHTARTTLRDRKLILDVRGLTALDDAARQWLASLALEGARFVPDSFLREVAAGMPEIQPVDERRTWLGRLSSALRSYS